MDPHLPQRRKQRLRIRFSLRSFFVLITVATVFAGWRYNQRSHFQISARKIQEHGGTIFYRWEEPKIGTLSVWVQNAYFQVSVPYQETLEDGSKITRTRIELAGRNMGNTTTTNKFYVGSSKQPRFQLADFLCGGHSDVAFDAISIPASSVNQDTIQFLTEVKNLDQLLLEIDELYFMVEASTRRTPKQRAEHLRELGQDLRRATQLIEDHLPEVSLYKRGVKNLGQTNRLKPLQ